LKLNDNSEKSELNFRSLEIIPNCPSQNNINNFIDPTDLISNNIHRNYIAKLGYDQNIDADFTLSERSYSDFDLYCSKSFFTKTEKTEKMFRANDCLYNIQHVP
jgi:hypothetical protein